MARPDGLARIGVAGGVRAAGIAEERRAPRLVERRPGADPVAEPLVDGQRVVDEAERGVAVGPAAGQRGRQVPVIQRQPGRDTPLEQRVDETGVEVHALLVDPVAVHHARPGHAESVGAEPEAGHEVDVLPVAVVVVDGDPAVVAALHGAGHLAEHVPDGRPLVVDVGGALDLERRRRRPPPEAVRELQRGHPFTAPAMMPDTRWRPASANSARSGMVASTTPAMMSAMSLK